MEVLPIITLGSKLQRKVQYVFSEPRVLKGSILRSANSNNVISTSNIFDDFNKGRGTHWRRGPGLEFPPPANTPTFHAHNSRPILIQSLFSLSTPLTLADLRAYDVNRATVSSLVRIVSKVKTPIHLPAAFFLWSEISSLAV